MSDFLRARVYQLEEALLEAATSLDTAADWPRRGEDWEDLRPWATSRAAVARRVLQSSPSASNETKETKDAVHEGGDHGTGESNSRVASRRDNLDGKGGSCPDDSSGGSRTALEGRQPEGAHRLQMGSNAGTPDVERDEARPVAQRTSEAFPDAILVGASGLRELGRTSRTPHAPIFADGAAVMGTAVRYVRDDPRTTESCLHKKWSRTMDCARKCDACGKLLPEESYQPTESKSNDETPENEKAAWHRGYVAGEKVGRRDALAEARTGTGQP